MLNYLLLLLLFAVMVGLCFVPGFIELKWPKDEGPISIDVTRDIDERYFAKAFSQYMDSALSAPEARELTETESQPWLFSGLTAKVMRTAIHRGTEDIVVAEGLASIPANTECPQVLFLKGDLATGDGCVLRQEVKITGDCRVGANNHVLCLAGRNVLLGDGTVVDGWVDAEDELIVGQGCDIKSRATAGAKATINGACSLKSVSAPLIHVSADLQDASIIQQAEEEVDEVDAVDAPRALAGQIQDDGAVTIIREVSLEREGSVGEEPLPEQPGRPDLPAERLEPEPSRGSAEAPLGEVPRRPQVLDTPLISWDQKLDEVVRERFFSATLEEIAAEISAVVKTPVPGRSILERAVALGVIDSPLSALNETQKPEYLRSLPVWLQAPETVRVRGNVSIPDGVHVPYDMIVEGNLETGTGVVFFGGVQVKGSASIGTVNHIERSLVTHGDVRLDEYTAITQCVDSAGSIIIRTGSRIGVAGLGGMASRESILIENGVTIYGKIYAETGIKFVKRMGAR